MISYTELGQAYLEDAERLLRHIRTIQAEKDTDLSGSRARRLRMLYDMYLDCRTTGHYLQRRGEQLDA